MDKKEEALELQRLMQKRSSARSRMVCGIVFSSIAIFSLYLSFYFGTTYMAGVDEEILSILLLVYVGLPFLCAGTPLLITGIIGFSTTSGKLNRMLADQKARETRNFNQQNYNYQQGYQQQYQQNYQQGYQQNYQQGYQQQYQPQDQQNYNYAQNPQQGNYGQNNQQ